MKNQVVVIVVGGLLSEALMRCQNPFVKKFLSESVANVCSKTVDCPETYFAQTALLYSTSTNYDNTLTKERNLFDVLKASGKESIAIYTGDIFTTTGSDEAVECVFCDNNEEGTEKAISYFKEQRHDFGYIYFGDAIKMAMKTGYMSEEYLMVINDTFSLIEKIRNEFPLCKMIVLSDHGGHGKVCDTSLDSDVTIPIIFNRICHVSERIEDANIIDIAPTVCKMLWVQKHEKWHGESLI